MKKLKVALVFVVLAFVPLFMVGCGGGVVPQTFTKDGMTIVAESNFTEQTAPFNFIRLESKHNIITGIRIPPTGLFPITRTLRQHTERIFAENGVVDAAIYVYDDGSGVIFEWFLHETDVEGTIYKFLGVTKKGVGNFYFFSFGCEAVNFGQFQYHFFEWAKQIVVE